MGKTQLYKNTSSHRSRYMTTVDNLSHGMKYTNNPLDDGYAKLLVNYDFKNDGESLIPRGGVKDIKEDYAYAYVSATHSDYAVISTGTMYVDEYDSSTAYLMRYALMGYKDSVGVYKSDNCILVLEPNMRKVGHAITASLTDDENAVSCTYKQPPVRTTVHDLTTLQGALPNRAIICSIFDGVPYMLCSTNGLVKLYAKYTDVSHADIVWGMYKISAEEIQPAQAINYGYNMLKQNPYSFSYETSATGMVQLTGVVPYDNDGNVILTTRAGTEITFQLCCKVPQDDIINEDKYFVQWELQDQTNGSDPIVLQPWNSTGSRAGSPEYDPAALIAGTQAITFTFTPTAKTFTLIVGLYKQSEIDSQQEYWDETPNLQALITRDDYVTANQTTTLASYNLLDADNTSAQNLGQFKADLGTSTGSCVWNHRLVLWGVPNATSTLFVSDVNNPAYFPYPNNVEVFSEDVIGAVPYKDALLVFTRGALYQITLSADGLSYTSKCMQQHLNMHEEDLDTIKCVQNMVYFKSDNYYYLVCPKYSYVGELEMTIAPVSRAVDHLLDNMPAELMAILQNTLCIDKAAELKLADYWVENDGNKINNYYKLYIEFHKDKEVHAFVDFVLSYDTVLRAWTTYIIPANSYRKVIYVHTQTGNSVYITPRVYNGLYYFGLNQMDVNSPKDELRLGDDEVAVEYFSNIQYLDTGARKFGEDLQKRFREIQYIINNLSAEQIHFNTGFTVDGRASVPIYEYEISQCVDPEDPNYGQVWVEPVLAESTDTTLYTEFNKWCLDTDVFPDDPVVKVRYSVSGKGYEGSMQLRCADNFAYELLHINWVYRQMFAR